MTASKLDINKALLVALELKRIELTYDVEIYSNWNGEQLLISNFDDAASEVFSITSDRSGVSVVAL